ncbi:hypothetical protein OFN60_37800, partial [Escherichia coli]|nr:hypothetical protein [Escherichia coli]
GKSSLLSEVLKDSADDVLKDILPSDLNRCTARATLIKYGEQLSFQVGDREKVPMKGYQDPAFISAINLSDEQRKNPELVKQLVTL